MVAGRAFDDVLLLKLDLVGDGSLIWARTVGLAGEEGARSVIQTSDGGFAVAGHSTGAAGASDFLVLKLNPDLSLGWARTFGGADYDYGYSIIQTTDGGFAVAGWTNSFGAGSHDWLVLKLDSNGNYPDCVQSCSPSVATPSLTISSAPLATSNCSPSISSPNLTVRTPDLTITDACSPLPVYECVANDGLHPRPRITCSPIPGGALFISSEETPIKIYSADGRVAYSGNLEKGQNRISLETGAYIWTARDCGGAGAPAYPVNFGKAVVR